MSARFTFDSHNDVMPIWAPDGSNIVFGSDRDATSSSLYQKPSNGAGAEQLLLKSAEFPFDWSPDRRFITYRLGTFLIGVLPLEGDRKPHVFEQVTVNQAFPVLSPDGRWIAYASSESGPREIYVQSFPTRTGKWQISKDGGSYPRWGRDSRELFYYAADGQLVSVPLSGDSAVRVGIATSLFKARTLLSGTTAFGFRQQYDVTRDGQRFLMNVPTEEGTPPSPIAVVVNWTAGLAR